MSEKKSSVGPILSIVLGILLLPVCGLGLLRRANEVEFQASREVRVREVQANIGRYAAEGDLEGAATERARLERMAEGQADNSELRLMTAMAVGGGLGSVVFLGLGVVGLVRRRRAA